MFCVAVICETDLYSLARVTSARFQELIHIVLVIGYHPLPTSGQTLYRLLILKLSTYKGLGFLVDLASLLKAGCGGGPVIVPLNSSLAVSAGSRLL